MIGFSIFILLLSACGDSSENADGGENIELEFWTMQLEPTFTEYLEDLIDAYEEENPNVTIDWLDVPADDLEQKVLSDVSADNAPDVVNLNTSFGASLADLDATTDMEEIVEEEVKDKYLEGDCEAINFYGEIIGLHLYCV